MQLSSKHPKEELDIKIKDIGIKNAGKHRPFFDLLRSSSHRVLAFAAFYGV